MFKKDFHLVNIVPIKDVLWESILSQVLEEQKISYKWNCNSHQSGADIELITDADKIFRLSLKSTRSISKKTIKVSSYRLTKCSCIDEVIYEIDHVRNNFDYYMILEREETQLNYVYRVLMIPSDVIKASLLSWHEKQNRNQTKQIGFSTNTCNGVKMDALFERLSMP